MPFKLLLGFAMSLVSVIALPSVASAQTQNLNLAWDPVAGKISGYYVYAGTSPGNYNILAPAVVPAGQTTYAFQASPGVKYYFAVSAFTATGVQSPRSKEIAGGVPTLTQPANQTGVVGTAVTTLALVGADPDGGTLQYTATGLPPGLTLAASTGRISGTPTTAGTYSVAAKVSDGTTASTRSFTWTITGGSATITVAAPSPASGTGASQTFSLTYADSLGGTDLVTAAVLFNSTITSQVSNTCLVVYNPWAKVLALSTDAGTSWVSGALGDATTLRNTQCSIALANSSATVSGKNVTVKLAMTFASKFAGTKKVYLFGAGAAGQNSDWQQRGTWTVPKY